MDLQDAHQIGSTPTESFAELFFRFAGRDLVFHDPLRDLKIAASDYFGGIGDCPQANGFVVYRPDQCGLH